MPCSNAAADARTKILNMVAEAWNQDIENLDIKDGYVISYETEDSDLAEEYRHLRHQQAG